MSEFLRLNRDPVVGTRFMLRPEQDKTVHEGCPLSCDSCGVDHARVSSELLLGPPYNAIHLEPS